MTAVVAASVSLAVLTACTGGAHPVVATASSAGASSADAGPSVSGTASPTAPPTTPPPASSVASLSGLPGTAGKPVVAVKIDNTSAGHPQYGLNDADIVYVEQVEAGITRLMAVFQSTMPTRVGPVRSGRESDLEILAAYGKVGLAYSGAQPQVNALIHASPQVTVEEDFTGVFTRDRSRYAPYNLYVDTAKFLQRHPSVTTANDIGLHFAAAQIGAPITSVTSLTARMSQSVTIGFTYDAANHRWLDSQGGAPVYVAGNSRVWTTNVLVQEVSVVASRFRDVNRQNTPLSHTVGSGNIRVLRPDGTMLTGTWSRKDAKSPTVYKDAHGQQITFAPGRTWILLVKKGNSVTTH
jgi:hypothetical protein